MVCRWDGGEVADWGDGERRLSKLSRNLFLKILTEGAVTMEAGSLFRYFTTLSFGGGSRLGVRCRGALLGRAEWEGEKTSSDQDPKDP